jgi:LysM repeat protein
MTGRITISPLPEAVCPYLGLLHDPQTYSASPDIPNYCHKAHPPAQVALEYQRAACCTPRFKQCPVYIAEVQAELPHEARPQQPVEEYSSLPGLVRPFWLVGLGVLLVALIAAGLWLSGILGFRRPAWAVAILPPASATPLPFSTLLPASNGSPTPTEPPPSSTPTLIMTASPTLTLTPTQTFTPTLPSPTPGPGLETPFGPSGYALAGGAVLPPFLVHSMAEGESLSLLAGRYRTTLAVLRAVNGLAPGVTIWPGTFLVILPGLSDPTGLPRLKPILLDKPARLADLAQTYLADPDRLRALNGLDDSEWVPAGRWIVVEVVPTPTPTPKP